MKVRLPLARRTIAGISCPYPRVRLRVRDRYGGFAVLEFRVDTQADFTALPITTAQREGIPFTTDHPGRARGLVGTVEKYRARIRILIAGIEHDWPCDFVSGPTQSPAGVSPPDLTPVLGRAGFLDEYAVTIDSGYLILTRLGPVRRWWRRRLHAIWHALGMVHPIDEPL